MRDLFTKILAFIKKNIALFIIIPIAFLAICARVYSITNKEEVDEIQEISYSEFLNLVDEGAVDMLYYSTSNEYMTATLYNEETKDMPVKERKEYEYSNQDKRLVLYPASDDFRERMLRAGVTMVLEKSNTVLADILSVVLSMFFPILYILLIVRILMRSNKKLTEDTLVQKSSVTFNDVIGHDEIIEDVRFITELIKNPKRGIEVGAKVPKGILFSGSPGTGKTLIAKAIAGEAGVPFLYMNASSFIEMYVGVGAKRVRELFEVARKNSPCIVFIDEIDSVGASRSMTSGHSENDQTLNALLQEMDGFSGRDGIFVIAATNRADLLDKALTRAGRFDRQIVVNPPSDWNVRKDLFDYYLAKYSVSDDVNTEALSKQTVGFTGSDIAAICNEAGLVAIMKQKSAIDMACLEEALDKHLFKGNRKNKSEFEQDKTIVAYHEAGHAVMTFLRGQEIARASIIATTSGVGGAVFGQDSNSHFKTKSSFINDIMICYAGRISEQIKFNEITTGACNDITQATRLLQSFVETYGFDEETGLVDVSQLARYGNKLGIPERIKDLANKIYDEAFKILNDNFELVERLATSLLKYETLSGDTIKELLSSRAE